MKKPNEKRYNGRKDENDFRMVVRRISLVLSRCLFQLSGNRASLSVRTSSCALWLSLSLSLSLSLTHTHIHTYNQHQGWLFDVSREAWHAVIHGVAKSRTRLRDWSDLIWSDYYHSSQVIITDLRAVLWLKSIFPRNFNLDLVGTWRQW